MKQNPHPVTVRNVTFGTGQPKICLPLVARNAGELNAQLATVASGVPDLVEFRADHYFGIEDRSVREEALTLMRNALDDIPLLFTFRTAREGGARGISPEAYQMLCLEAIVEGFDMVDVELFTGENFVRTITAAAHQKGVAVVMSSHDFEKTPPRDELICRFRMMEALGADLVKLSVMPCTPEDVLTLLSATAEQAASGRCPVASMSMGHMGVISRLCGETFGSCITFGAAAKASAPGQLDVHALRSVLNILHQ